MKHYYFYYQEVYLVPILSKKLNGIAVDKIVKAGLNISNYINQELQLILCGTHNKNITKISGHLWPV